MRISRILIAFISLLFVMKSRAAAPNWTVNPSAFQYSMTVTSVANVNCIELVNPTNKIAAFVGATCRGVSSTSTIINGKYIAYVVVYSNVNSGETVTFKIYDAPTDVVYDAKGSVVFQDNASFGVTTSPYTLRNNNLPTALNLSNSLLMRELLLILVLVRFLQLILTLQKPSPILLYQVLEVMITRHLIF